MELADYFRIVKRRGWLIIVLSLLTAIAAFGYSYMQQPVYKSTAQLLITSRPDFGQTQAANILMRDFAAWLRSSKRAEAVIADLDLDEAPLELLSTVTVAPSTDSNIIKIEVKHVDGNIANNISRVWGDQLTQWRNEENAGLRKEDRIEAQLIDDPRFGLDGPKTKINTAAGAVFGALLGVMLIFLLEWIDSGVVRRAEDIERYLDVPVIGKIPN